MMKDDLINEEMEMNEKTDGIFETLFYDEYLFEDIDDLLDQEVISEMEERNIFLEGLVERLEQLKVNIDFNDKKQIINEIRIRYKRHGIDWEKAKPVKNWINDDVKPSVGRNGNKENLYNVCIALDMNIKETFYFFIKYYLTLPFNYKDRIDAIYYYSFLNNKDYQFIKNIITETENIKKVEFVNVHTNQMARQIGEIDNDEEFLKYLSQHCFDKQKQFLTAKDMIKSFIEDIGVKKASELHYRLFGFYEQREKREKSEELPNEFIQSLPIELILGRFINSDENSESYETLRKTLIILNFYSYFQNVLDEYSDDEENLIEEVRENALDFLEEVNGNLSACGFAQMYLRHPFDYFICSCAVTTDPIQSFHDINLKRFIDE